jgi:AcrR family transcriptional regulator
MDKRQASRDETRARILEAARQLLADESSHELTMEAVARRADVSRLTIYYQFDSRAGLLEALYDHLAARGRMQRMTEVFHEKSLPLAIGKMVDTFVRFWSTDTAAMRRLRAMAALDKEIGSGIRARDARRPHIAREMAKRVGTGRGKRAGALEMEAALLGMLSSFEAYDALAQAGHGDDEIAAALTRLARCVMEHKTG